MVKKTSSRQKNRTAEIAKLEHLLSSDAIEGKKDEELFLLDVKGNDTLYRAKRKELSSKSNAKSNKKLKVSSQKEKKKIKNYLKNSTTFPKKENKKSSHHFDIWNNGDSPRNKDKVVFRRVKTLSAGISPVEITSSAQIPKTNRKKGKKNKTREIFVAVDVAQPGQSYHPDKEQHNHVLQQALEIELKREEIKKYNKTPLTTGMKKETLDLLIQDDADFDTDEDDEMNEVDFKPIKKKDKLTRAQRNKQNRHRKHLQEVKQHQGQKKFLHSIHSARKITKDLNKEQDLKRVEKKNLEKKRKVQAQLNIPGTKVWKKMYPLSVTSLPVALPSEIQNNDDSSLRKITPKGSLLYDRMYSMCDRKMLNKRKS